MKVRYEIRVCRSIIYGGKYFWKIMKYDIHGEELVTFGHEDTLDLSYEKAKKVYEELAK